MPQLADLSVTNDAGTAQTFTGLVPAGADRSPARWRMDTGLSAVPMAVRPTLEMLSRWNGRRDARHLEEKLVLPYYVTDGYGVSSILANCLYTATWTIPTNVPDTKVADLVKYVYDIHLKTASIGLAVKAGYAPT